MMLRAARNLGFVAESSRSEFRSKSQPTKTYKVVVYKDKNDIPVNNKARKLNPRMEGKWDVDIYNLPIPQSAYPSPSYVAER